MKAKYSLSQGTAQHVVSGKPDGQVLLRCNSVQPAASVTWPASHVDKEQAARLLRVISKHPKLKLHLL